MSRTTSYDRNSTPARRYQLRRSASAINRFPKLNRLPSQLRIKHVRIKIGPTLPADRTKLGIHSYPRHFRWILKRFKDSLELYERLKVNLTIYSILKTNIEMVSASCPSFDDVFQHGLTPEEESVQEAPASARAPNLT